MKRSDFLAFLPALSTVPFIGKNIVRTEGGIFVEDPVPLVTVKQVPDKFNILDLDVRLYSGGEQVGTARIDNVTMEWPLNGYKVGRVECRLFELYGQYYV